MFIYEKYDHGFSDVFIYFSIHHVNKKWMLSYALIYLHLQHLCKNFWTSIVPMILIKLSIFFPAFIYGSNSIIFTYYLASICNSLPWFYFNSVGNQNVLECLNLRQTMINKALQLRSIYSSLAMLKYFTRQVAWLTLKPMGFLKCNQ